MTDLPACAGPRAEPGRQSLFVLEAAKKVRFYRCRSDICRYFSIIISDAHRIGHHLLACWGRVGGHGPLAPTSPLKSTYVRYYKIASQINVDKLTAFLSK